ncbi:MAG TPA: hypothetical protein DCX06_13985 [Opitutae bacterium]|nr:hypothetical protein [Opitutae bacterium]
MTDQSEEKRPKLKLSRDVKPPEPQQTVPSQTENTAPAPSPSKPKLKIAKQTTSEPKTAPAETPTEKTPAPVTQPEEQAERIAPPPPPPMPPREPTSPAVKATAAGSTSAPPPISNTRQPSPSSEPTHSADADLETLSKDKNSSTLISILIIVALFIVLLAGAAGLWFILKSSSEETIQVIPSTAAQPTANVPTLQDVPNEPSAEPIQKHSITDPVARAKATIAEVQTAQQVSEMIGIEGPTAMAPPVESAVISTATKALTPTLSTPAPSTELQAAVTEFLSTLHIDGLRSGSNPKVMINAESYLLGEEVNRSTGLTFEGVKDGKLLFKDRNGLYYLKSF